MKREGASRTHTPSRWFYAGGHSLFKGVQHTNLFIQLRLVIPYYEPCH